MPQQSDAGSLAGVHKQSNGNRDTHSHSDTHANTHTLTSDTEVHVSRGNSSCAFRSVAPQRRNILVDLAVLRLSSQPSPRAAFQKQFDHVAGWHKLNIPNSAVGVTTVLSITPTITTLSDFHYRGWSLFPLPVDVEKPLEYLPLTRAVSSIRTWCTDSQTGHDAL